MNKPKQESKFICKLHFRRQLTTTILKEQLEERNL